MKHISTSINDQNQNLVKTLSINDIELIQSYLEEIIIIKKKNYQDKYNSNNFGDFSWKSKYESEIINNKKLNYIVNFMVSKIQSNNINYQKPIKLLETSELNYLYSYLEKIKLYVKKKASQETISHSIPQNRATDIYDPIKRDVPIDWRTFSVSNNQQQNSNFNIQEAGIRGAVCTRSPKKSLQSMEMGYVNDYNNPYEHGTGQKSMGMLYKKPYDGPYDNSGISSEHLGLPQNMYNERFPGCVRNINIESSLLQHEITKIPGQRNITQQNFDRWNLLPFDPQDPKHIVWKDNMPRGGYPTRNDRLEL